MSISLLGIIHSVPRNKRSLSLEITDRDKNFRDVLMHLYEWHAMLERWYREGMAGDTPSMPAPGYKWRNLKELNYQIWMNYQEVSLSQAIRKLELSHERVMALIQNHTEEEIMTKKHYKWVKTSNLYSYFAANTVNHYIWAIQRCTEIAKKL
ncbi:ClbS/DfsB family four-helix bundle protein [Paenibacillus barcinonensis]|uniref:ClbS/DfsB family four-helix bundle protein n=1 Tax=Paenibacillus barcinonensis TaxID=198119 RepID=UPI001FC906BC|nr:ClbS/DfsB family four-helix bundle protein [Paenibacillus barcinonensis]